MTERTSTRTKLAIAGSAVAYLLSSCASPPTSSPETRPSQGTVSATCPDTTDTQHQNLVEFTFDKLPPGNGGTIRIEYNINPRKGDKSTNYTPPRRLNIPGNVPTKDVFLDIPFAFVTDINTGVQTIATVNLSECVTPNSEVFSDFFKDIKPDQIYPPGQQASFNGKDWKFGPEAKARTRMRLNPHTGIRPTYTQGKAGTIYRRG